MPKLKEPAFRVATHMSKAAGRLCQRLSSSRPPSDCGLGFEESSSFPGVASMDSPALSSVVPLDEVGEEPVSLSVGSSATSTRVSAIPAMIGNGAVVDVHLSCELQLDVRFRQCTCTCIRRKHTRARTHLLRLYRIPPRYSWSQDEGRGRGRGRSRGRGRGRSRGQLQRELS